MALDKHGATTKSGSAYELKLLLRRLDALGVVPRMTSRSITSRRSSTEGLPLLSGMSKSSVEAVTPASEQH